jgi:peptidoglycan/xylan/chitin deacetylase (PgdA/CDA1 family)
MNTRYRAGLIAVVMILAAALGGCRRGPDDGQATTPGDGPEVVVELEPRTIPVFCYHKMSAESTSTYAVETADFTEQLTAMSEAGFETVTPTQIADYLDGKGELPDKPVCITFDDGPMSVLTVSKPLMDKHGYVGAAFLIAGSVGARGNLDWDDVAELEEAGWEIGSHTVSHIHPTRVSADKCAEEFENSRETIREHIEGDCVAIAYPYGLYDDETLQITRDAGYRIGFTIDRGPADQTDKPLLIPREMLVDGNSMRTFRRWLGQEKIHLEDLDPPVGERFDSREPTITARLADDIPAGDIEFTVAGKLVDVAVGEDGTSLTLKPKLAAGANIIRANYWGGTQRELSWLVICDAD